MNADFFTRQARARRRTTLLLVYLAAAVLGTVAVLEVIVYIAFDLGQAAMEGQRLEAWLDHPASAGVALITLAVVACGSLWRWYQLRDGGAAVAEMVGARLVDLATADTGERRLINVVEEMSIASGTPVPVLYVLDHESGINAFVAGYRPSEAVLVVTRGALDALDRDELQGVVGHEFSHVLNGDMRINVRLIAVLAGLLALGKLGWYLLRSTARGRGRDKDGIAGMALLGVGLLIAGYVGMFFGRLIQAAVSRQREFLADASAVQFTRNPSGIAGALWRIQHHAEGSLLDARDAEDARHMCFAEGVRVRLRSLLATHPPIDTRIAAIDPHFAVKRAARARARPTPAPTPGVPGAAAGLAAGGAAVVGSVGTVQPAHMDYAHTLHASLPEALRDAAHTPEGARAVVLALLLTELAPERMVVARALLAREQGEVAARLADDLRGQVAALGAAVRLPVVDLATPVLRQLDDSARDALLASADRVARLDRSISQFEFVLLTLLRRRLRPGHGRADRRPLTSFEPVIADVRALLTLVARAGARDEASFERAFARAAAGFGAARLVPVHEAWCRSERLPEVLERLDRLSPLLKRPLLEACADCVLDDGRIEPAEAELLRAVSESLDCPMPPLVPESGWQASRRA